MPCAIVLNSFQIASLDLGQIEKAETYSLKGLDAWTRAQESQLSSINSFDATQILATLISAVFIQEKYDLAEKFAKQS